MQFQTLMHLAAGQIDLYRAMCTKLIERFGKTQDHAVASSVLQVCTLHPGAQVRP